MKNGKKLISLATAIFMLASILAIPTMATETDNLKDILSKYVVGEATYTNTFDEEKYVSTVTDSTHGFGKFRGSNAEDSLEWDNGVLKVVHDVADTTSHVDFLSKNISGYTTTSTNKVLVKFTVDVENLWGQLIVRFPDEGTGAGLAEVRLAKKTDEETTEPYYDVATYYKNEAGGNANSTTRVEDGEITLAFLLDYDDDTYNLWINKELNELTEKNALYRNLNFNRVASEVTSFKYMRAYVDKKNGDSLGSWTLDNVGIYPLEKSDDFIKAEETINGIQSFSDICTVDSTDSKPTDLKAASDIAGDTGCTVEITDSKGYVQNEHIVFPLVEDTTNMTVKVTSGSVTVDKTIENVPMPAAYTFGEINWGDASPAPGAKFEAVSLPVTVRNEASNNGRLFVTAALYDNTGATPVMEAVSVQDNIVKDNKIQIKLDLTNKTELPASSILKVFAWNTELVPFAAAHSKAY